MNFEDHDQTEDLVNSLPEHQTDDLLQVLIAIALLIIVVFIQRYQYNELQDKESG